MQSGWQTVCFCWLPGGYAALRCGWCASTRASSDPRCPVSGGKTAIWVLEGPFLAFGSPQDRMILWGLASRSGRLCTLCRSCVRHLCAFEFVTSRLGASRGSRSPPWCAGYRFVRILLGESVSEGCCLSVDFLPRRAEVPPETARTRFRVLCSSDAT